MIFTSIRKQLKLFSILSSIILLIPITPSPQACGWYPEEEEIRYMVFNPDLTQNKAWWSFFYNMKLHYLDGQVRSTDDEQVLVHEWIDHLKVNVKEEDVFNCLFGSLSDSALQLNPFYQHIQNEQNARIYFERAHEAENVTSGASLWDGNDTDNAVMVQQRQALIKKVQTDLEDSQDDFFRRKYAFQLVKLAYYESDENLFNKIYLKHFNNDPHDILGWWALHYKSMMYEHQQKLDSANLLHARIFSHSTNKMLVSRQFFSRQNLTAVLDLAQNNEEQADVLVLAEVINPGRSLENLRKIVELKPDHRHLPLLIGREVNKIESWIGSDYIEVSERFSDIFDYAPDSTSAMNRNADLQYLNDFKSFLKSVLLTDEKQADRYTLSLSYLELLSNNPQAAADLLKEIITADRSVIYQKQILDLILLTKQKDISDPNVQDELGKAFESVINNRGQEFESQKILLSISSYLRYEFARKGMIHLAGLFDNYANNKFCYSCTFGTLEYAQIQYLDRHASARDMEKLVTLYDRQDKNTLEKILLRPYSNKNYLIDLLGVKHLREGNVNDAAKAFRQIPDDFWYSFSNANENLIYDPFKGNRELLVSSGMETYNKREVVEKMIALENDAKTNAATKADTYYQLGNAWFNFTSNSWFMIDYWRSGGSSANTPTTRAVMKRALEYYKKALAVEKRGENKAKLLYMIALLSNKADKKAYALQFEQLSTTAFYNKINCLTLHDLANN